MLYIRDALVAADINKNHQNSYSENLDLPKNITASNVCSEVTCNADIIFLALPAQQVRFIPPQLLLIIAEVLVF